MRKIGLAPIMVFLTLFGLSVALGIVTSAIVLGKLPLGDFRGIVLVLAGVVFVYLYAILLYRVFIRVVPLLEGEIAQGSREELAAQVHFLFYLILFNTLIRTNFFPAPLMRLIYQLLGAQLGENSFCVGVILDPALTSVGDNSIIGHDAALFSHVIEGKRLALYPITIGNNVTVGAKSIVMPGVFIGDGAIVPAATVVPKGTRLEPGEIWAGENKSIKKEPSTK